MGFVTVDEVHERYGRHYTVNLNHIPSDVSYNEDRARARIEFRLWDGSMNPGRIQAKVKLSAAILDHISAGRGGAPRRANPTDHRAGPPEI